MVDNHGIWTVEPSYGFATWDFNVQAIYRLHLPSNHADFGLPFVKFMRDNFNEETMFDSETGKYSAGVSQRTFLRYQFLDREYWHLPHKGKLDGPAKLLWACHSLYLHHLYTGDDSILSDLLRILDAGSQTIIDLLEEEDGKLVIPFGQSWECGTGRNPTGYLATLKWALSNAIRISEQISERVEKIDSWKSVLSALTGYPTGEEGFYHTEDMKPMPHRHWTHLMSIFPYDMLEDVDSEYENIGFKSLENFAHQSCGLDGEESQSFAPVAGIIMYAMYNQAGNIPKLADKFLHYRGGRAICVWPSTMYKEYGPVIETPLFFANALQECCLMTRKNGVHIFPAFPQGWKDVCFGNWLAGNGFIVSASRKNGAIEWIVIESRMDGSQVFYLDQPIDELCIDGEIEPKTASSFRVSMKRGQKIVIRRDEKVKVEAVPVSETYGESNPFGMNETYYGKRPHLSDLNFEPIQLDMKWDETYRRYFGENDVPPL